jgi:hypothetical protein
MELRVEDTVRPAADPFQHIFGGRLAKFMEDAVGPTTESEPDFKS